MCCVLRLTRPACILPLLLLRESRNSILVNVDKMSASAQVTGAGIHQATASSSASLLAPIPVGGPEFRVYLSKSRLFINGNGFGMYFFSYGNYYSITDYLGVTFLST